MGVIDLDDIKHRIEVSPERTSGDGPITQFCDEFMKWMAINIGTRGFAWECVSGDNSEIVQIAKDVDTDTLVLLRILWG